MMIASLKGISKSFGEVQAVKDLSFEVTRGEIFGLIGPNGSGKTTTIRMIMNIIMPDRGEIVLFGEKLHGGLKDRIGYLPEERGLYRKMKVMDILLFFARSQGLSHKEAGKRLQHWLNRLGMGEWAGKKLEELSKGMQQKIQLITTVVHNPELLILDEPFSGMDPVNTELLKDVLLELNRSGTTIMFSTHIMEQAEKLCSSLCLIKYGRPILLGPLADIKARFGRNTVMLEYAGDLSFLEGHPLVERIYAYENYSEIRLKEAGDPEALLRDVLGKVKLRRFEVMAPSLHSIYLDQVGGPDRG